MSPVSERTPMMQQYRELKDQHPDAILFFRLGDFYEMFYEDAETASRELELTLTSRDAGGDRRAPMCGVPHHAAERYIARLVERGYDVAICEQMEDPSESRGLVDRQVVRVVTPGTLTEGPAAEAREHRYVAAVVLHDSLGGVAAADVATGDFRGTERPLQANSPVAAQGVLDELARLAPAEVLVPERDGPYAAICRWVEEQLPARLTVHDAWVFEQREAYRCLTRHFGTRRLDAFGCEDRPAVVRAAGGLLHYLEETQRVRLRHLGRLHTYSRSGHMELDRTTRRNLELTRRLLDDVSEGSLLWVLDATVTAAGGRRLRRWLERPLTDRTAIGRRHDAVGVLLAEPAVRAALRDRLAGMYDMERLVGRAVYGSANARDLGALAASLGRLPGLAEELAPLTTELIAALRDRLPDLTGLTAELEAALHPDPPVTVTEGGIIAAGYDDEVDRLREAAAQGKGWVAALEERERERTGIRSLKVGFNKVFGYYIEVTHANQARVPDDYERKQTLANAERYVVPALKEREAEILGAEERLQEVEYRLFVALREQVAEAVDAIQQAATVVATLDVLASLAHVAERGHYVRPEIREDQQIHIEGGRHPVLERTLDTPFVPNDTHFDEGRRLLLVTGPNMAGKSTYLRQTALIVLMAQLGSYVPADAAAIGVVDRIFTRVGAADDLATGRSTFMVEMSEVAHILHHASPRSLLILDEVGRGTATYDGLSIAWAVAEYVHTRPRLGCRTLFATHYHELTALADHYDGVENLSVAIVERKGEITFLHRVRRGAADRSYGIQVARLAGLPPTVIDRAARLLALLEGAAAGPAAVAERDGGADPERGSDQGTDRAPVVPARPPLAQLSLLAEGGAGSAGKLAAAGELLRETEAEAQPAVQAEAWLAAALAGVDLERTTPLAALQLLHRWRQRLEEEG